MCSLVAVLGHEAAYKTASSRCGNRLQVEAQQETPATAQARNAIIALQLLSQ
jgi:hypothetical protein